VEKVYEGEGVVDVVEEKVENGQPWETKRIPVQKLALVGENGPLVKPALPSPTKAPYIAPQPSCPISVPAAGAEDKPKKKKPSKIYTCPDCGKTFGSYTGHRYHVKNKVCQEKAKRKGGEIEEGQGPAKVRRSKERRTRGAKRQLAIYSNISLPRFARNLLARRFAHRRRSLLPRGL